LFYETLEISLRDSVTDETGKCAVLKLICFVVNAIDKIASKRKI